jgi:hypothetical protein
MANSAANVFAAKPDTAGGVLIGPKNSPAPADALVAPAAGFTPSGYISADGMTKTESRDSQAIQEWGGLTVLTVQTGFEATFQWAFLEYLNAEAAKAIYGDTAVTVVPATTEHGEQITVAVDGTEAPYHGWLFETFSNGAKVRIFVPNAHVTDSGDTQFVATDAAVRDVTITASPDAAGKLYYELSDNGVTSAA